jgi:hypothetical protein
VVSQLLEQESAIPGIDELDARILEKQQDLEALAGGDPSAIQKYNKLVDEVRRSLFPLELFSSSRLL